MSDAPARERVCVVIVTYNRAALLRECLDAVLGQTRLPDEVLVVDNASTDETPAVLATYGDAIGVLRLPTNEGGAGGFHEGMAEAVRRGVDWLWVMDDDTIPEPAALERLLAARERLRGLPEPMILASRVLWTNGRVHPMNPPFPTVRDVDVYLSALERGVAPIRASSLLSILVRREAVERHGPPRKGFWIWSDDMDFTQRILRDETGYVVPDSVVVHKTATAHQPWHGGPRFYYAIRNGLFILRGDTLSPREKLAWAYMVAGQTRSYLQVERWRPSALAVVARGLRDGLVRPRP